ncbi:conserved exported hypothetical protein [Bradyrhizobium oligotrophicum S58]|uniref:Uncharacterized protein n=2 Tax=Bradyrhizobium oligotrophicum TaxID=44255 RepID=M4Z296_9BRAD|nr:conserved exported hypothetical protein [Bradyrhizobium oligotrophicum S58]
MLGDARVASEESSSSLRVMEPRALAKGEAQRIGGRLIVTLRSGKTKVYSDRLACSRPAEETKCIRYSLVVHAKTRSSYIIAKQYYEGLEAIVVNEVSGVETIVRGIPSYSSDGRSLVVFLENDPEVGFAVEVWQKNGDRFAKVWTGSPNSDGIYVSYRLIRWISEDAFLIETKTKYGGKKPDALQEVLIVRDASGWKIAPR